MSPKNLKLIKSIIKQLSKLIENCEKISRDKINITKKFKLLNKLPKESIKENILSFIFKGGWNINEIISEYLRLFGKSLNRQTIYAIMSNLTKKGITKRIGISTYKKVR